MGMTAVYRRMTADEFAQVLEAVREKQAEGHPYVTEAFLVDTGILSSGLIWTFEEMGAADIAGRVFRLEKEWHALHFLLTGDTSLDPPCPVPPPLGNVVFGGVATPIAAGNGPVRCLDPQEVREVADVLRTIPAEELQRRYNAGDFNERRIYPTQRPRGWDEEGLEPLLEMYPDLVEFFGRAAEAGELVLISVG